MVKKLIQVPFVRSFSVLIADRSMQLVSQLVNVFVISSFLGAADFGVLMYALALYGILLSASNFGLERVLVVELSHALDEKSKGDIILSGLVIKVCTSLLLLAVLYFVSPLFSYYISPDVYSTLLLLSVNVFFSSWIIIDAFNQYSGEFRSTAFARIAATVLGILVRLLIVVLQLDFKWMVLSFLLEQAICLLFCVLLSPRFRLFFKQFATVKFSFRKNLLRSGLFVVISAICIIIYFRASQAIVEQKFSKAYLGVYSLVLILLEMPVSIASVLSTLFTPRLAKLKQEAAGKQQSADSYVLFIFLACGVIAAVAILLTGFILSFILNESFNGFFALLLKGLIVIPIIFAGYCFNLFLLTERKFNIYLIITIMGAAAAMLFLYFTVSFISMSNAVYYFVVTQFVACIVIPLILQKALINKTAYSILLPVRPQFGLKMKTVFSQLLR